MYCSMSFSKYIQQELCKSCCIQVYTFEYNMSNYFILFFSHLFLLVGGYFIIL